MFTMRAMPLFPRTLVLLALLSSAPVAAQSCGLTKRFHFVQDNGYRVTVKLTRGGPHQSDTTGSADAGGGQRGVIKDVLLIGRNLSFTIEWQNGTAGRYTGVIQLTSRDEERQWGVVRGTTVDVNHPQSQANWNTEEPFFCSRTMH